jgi:hypothetical protein
VLAEGVLVMAGGIAAKTAEGHVADRAGSL